MSFVAFMFAALVLAITPGPGMAYVVARTVAGGRRVGFSSCIGTAVGGFVHVAAAAVGLSLIIAQSAAAFTVIKYAGAAYLVYLGIRMLVRNEHAVSVGSVVAQGASRAFIEGAVVEALNIKTALFFLAFLPQFVVHGEPAAPQLVLLGSICVVLNTSVDFVAVFGASRILQAEAVRVARAKVLTKMSGVTMLILGAYLALARRPA